MAATLRPGERTRRRVRRRQSRTPAPATVSPRAPLRLRRRANIRGRFAGALDQVPQLVARAALGARRFRATLGQVAACLFTAPGEGTVVEDDVHRIGWPALGAERSSARDLDAGARGRSGRPLAGRL